MEKVTMSVQEMALQMGISLSKAYELTKESDFPIVRVGKRVLIPVAEFQRWLCGRTNQKCDCLTMKDIEKYKLSVFRTDSLSICYDIRGKDYNLSACIRLCDFS